MMWRATASCSTGAPYERGCGLDRHAVVDLDAAQRCLADPPNVAAAAYHCQQEAEKLIKAVLVALHIAYPRGRSGHDLGLAAALILLSGR
jgi:HEPN domain-containing protein